MTEQNDLARSVLVDEAFGELDGVGHDLIQGHRRARLHGCGRLPGPSLVPLDDEKAFFESSIPAPVSSRSRLTSAAV